MPAWLEELPFATVTPELRDWWKANSPEPLPGQFGSLHGVPWNNWGITYPAQFGMMHPGKLWWPTGASRFGVYTGIADQDTVDQWRVILMGDDEGEVSRQAGRFNMYDGQNTMLERSMYMLPPRPLAFYLTEKPSWIVTLVDVRYWWWFYNTEDLMAEPVGTWDELFELFRSTLEIDPADWSYATPDEAYVLPGDYLAEASHIPLPILMDAAAWSIGCRVVVDFDTPDLTGKVSIMPLAESRLNRENGLKLKQVLSGGRYDMRSMFGATEGRDAGLILPASVRVSYPRVDPDTGDVTGRTAYDVDVATLDGFEGYNLFGQAVIYDTAETTSDEPDDSDLIFLADQLAKDYLGYEAEGNINVTLAGIRYLDPCGLYDAVEFCDYIEADDEIIEDETDDAGHLIKIEKERLWSYTKVTRTPFLWRSFTLHHQTEGGGGGSGSGGSGSGSSPGNTFDCGDGIKHPFTITRLPNGKFEIVVTG